ncbi:MAG TPA: FCD domain-containing protein [Candidatus Binataceae bacterium]|nr:FCD domain-containing protein [Candidatus Binataceae bacterium]
MATADPRKLASETAVRRFIMEAIENGSMAAGAKLPTERALAKRFRVPRSVARKALLPLEIEGKISRQVGRGTFVSDHHDRHSVALNDPGDMSPTEVLDACLTCYPHMAELAVATATAADLRLIQQSLQLLRRSHTTAEYVDRDAAFHQAIANATHNKLLIEIARAISRARERIGWGDLTTYEATPHDHEGILEALNQRNAKLAYERTKAHMLHARRSLLGGTS